MKKLIGTLMFGGIIALSLASCNGSIKKYDSEAKSLAYIIASDVITEVDKNSLHYEVFLGDPEIKSRSVYYFINNGSTYECILQHSFLNEYILSKNEGDKTEIPLTSSGEIDTSYYHYNKDSLVDLERADFKMKYTDITYTLGDEYLYVNNQQFGNNGITDYESFKSFIETFFGDTLQDDMNARIAIMAQQIGAFGSIVEMSTGGGMSGVSACISGRDMESQMSTDGKKTDFFKFFEEYLTEEEYQIFEEWIYDYVIDWSLEPPGSYSVPLFLTSDLETVYPYISITPYWPVIENGTKHNEELFYVNMYMMYI